MKPNKYQVGSEGSTDISANIALMSQMIDIAKADGVLRKSEYQFLLKVALDLQIDETTFKKLFKRKSENSIVSVEDKVRHFYKLIELMIVDNEIHRLEIERLSVAGLCLGLKPSIITEMLNEVKANEPGKTSISVLRDIYAKG